MTMENEAIAFGPVPSRRLGMSLGINNIPPKICTYSCVYCQIGKTLEMSIKRRVFYSPGQIYESVKERVEQVRLRGIRIDYLSFVPDGEPTLDLNLGEEIKLLKGLGIKIAVITNSSLLWMEEVRRDLAPADWVCVKVDAVSPEAFKKVDRPHGRLSLERILEGLETFSREFGNQLVSETMLIKGLNDSPEEIEKIAEFLSRIKPETSYIMVPTRPPAEEWAEGADEETLHRSYLIFKAHGLRPLLLTGSGEGSFGFTGDAERDILATAAVHPMEKEAVEEILRRSGADWSAVEKLIKEGKLREITYRGRVFLVRVFGRKK